MWYSRISRAPEGDFSPIADAIVWFENEYQAARKDIEISGRIEVFMMRLPGLVEYYWRHLQELEAILEWFDILLTKTMGKARKKYLEHYNRDLSDRTAEKFAEADPDVLTLRLLRNEITLMRNQFLGIHKALEVAQYQCTNVRALRVAGMEDATI